MLFSYYFDINKTHLLNCHFRVLQFTELEQGRIEIMFSAEMEEIRNGGSVKKESSVGTFRFPAPVEGEERHDIDFTRIRHTASKKWIFTVINNKDQSQRVEVGLISSSANKNPLGLDVYNDNHNLNVELKANNLSILDPTYTPPELTQVIAESRFNSPGLPQRFTSLTASYDGQYQNMRLSEFQQIFLEPIPSETYFNMAMDIAPYEIDILQGQPIFELTVPGLGKVNLFKHHLEYQIEDGTSSDIVRASFEEAIEPSTFWNNGMTSNARLSITGDGEGNVSISYNNYHIEGHYDNKKEISRIEFRGGVSTRILDN